MMVTVWMISTWRPSPGCSSRSGTTQCGARQLATVFWLDSLFSPGGSTIKVRKDSVMPAPFAQEASFIRTVWTSSTGVRTTRWAGRSAYPSSKPRYCGQYLVGHAFASTPELADIIFQARSSSY